jgi:peptide chain release factor 2
LKAKVDPWKAAWGEWEALHDLASIVEANDANSLRDLKEALDLLKQKVSDLERQTFLGAEHDANPAILSITAGAGGTESCDWVAMLFRMYSRWSESKGFRRQVLDYLAGEEAGIKSVTMRIEGEYAYGWLQGESGVHRLVRISPFDANRRRHTSFAAVEVIPEVSDEIQIEIDEKDLRIDVYRASGPGGQGVNTTDSAVRITHLPTGIVVQCQNERSQHKNKAFAMKVLRARLMELERRKRQEQQALEYGKKKKIEWGSQIRSYVLHPYQMVKDHRTGLETGKAQAVLDGEELDPFLEAYLKWKAHER